MCCGLGGLSFGFNDKNNSFVGLDLNPNAIKSYKANVWNSEGYVENITKVDPSSYSNIDIIVAGPICQPHSRANIKCRTRDTSIIKGCLRFIDELKPKTWILEEVPAIKEYDLIPENLITTYKLTDVNLPNRRERAFSGIYPRFHPESFNGIWIGKVFWTRLVKTPIAHMRGIGHGRDDYQKTLRDYQDLAKALTSAGIIKQMPNHPFDEPVMKFLLGFPQDYIVSGDKKTDRQEQIGNAVSPEISRRIWEEMKKGRKYVRSGGIT